MTNQPTHLIALLPHPRHEAALVLSSADGSGLPTAHLDERIELDQIDRVRQALSAIITLPFNVLCYLAESGDQMLFLLEARETSIDDRRLPGGTGWLSLDEIHAGRSLPEALRPALAAWLEERRAGGAGEFRAPWAQPGWYAEAEAWIAAQVSLASERLESIEALKSWGLSMVMRVQTATRWLYFKAARALPLFVNEGVVMRGLARLYPENLPMPLAVEPGRGWMLLEDLGQPLRGQASPGQNAELFRQMARLQINSTRQVDELLTIGCIDRRIPWLVERLDALFADEITLSKLEAAERDRLRAALPRLQAMLAELDALTIPPALVHGDLHAGNVALVDGRAQFFDWTDAAVTHPFFDLLDIYPLEDAQERQALEAAYRGEWEQVFTPEAVRRAFELARVLYGLHHAVSYSVIVNALQEPERENLNAGWFFLRQVLKGLSESSS